MMKRTQQGFTLIELMIVVAIIGILAAIALPAYQNYVAKSQASAALSEITPGKTQLEVSINEGVYPSKATSIGLQASTERCSSITVSSTSTDGVASITCTIKGNPKVNSKTIAWHRDTDGNWACTTSVDSSYKPKGCD